jgi:hypothetical protein
MKKTEEKKNVIYNAECSVDLLKSVVSSLR